MAKRRKKGRKKSVKKNLRFYALSTLLFFFLVTIIGVGYYIYSIYSKGVEEDKKQIQKPVGAPLAQIKEREKEALHSILSEAEDYKKSQKKESLQKTHNKHVTKSQEQQPVQTQKSTPIKVSRRLGGSNAKLVIIIDDVAFGYQVRALKSLHLPITLSFFPASSYHPNTPRYAKEFSHYMIHLPMEAIHYSNEEKDTLRVQSTPEFIDKVVKNIRRDFPKAKYINNHTGSKFTANLDAVKRLVKVLDRYGFVLVDSRTTPRTKIPQVMHELGRNYLHRDIFLDNDPTISSIKKQILHAVRLAKRRGYAIAIGHPYKSTIEALRQSKKLLRQVKLVYIDQL